jgi:ribosome-associated translation inhibitor RaiA
MNVDRSQAPVVVQCSSIAVAPALRHRARAGVERMTAKYFNQLNAATVYFSREGKEYRCTVNIDMGALRIVTGQSLGFCCHAALDESLRKAGKQLRRLKRASRDDKVPRTGFKPKGGAARPLSWTVEASASSDWTTGPSADPAFP